MELQSQAHNVFCLQYTALRNSANQARIQEFSRGPNPRPTDFGDFFCSLDTVCALAFSHIFFAYNNSHTVGGVHYVGGVFFAATGPTPCTPRYAYVCRGHSNQRGAKASRVAWAPRPLHPPLVQTRPCNAPRELS
jgi:hypothetical protein